MPEYKEIGWTFESTVVAPSGVEVRASIYVPKSMAWDGVGEAGEIVQSCTGRAVADLRDASAGNMPIFGGQR
jgi:hypothetical protein